jgi:hypothetical protein
MARQAPAVLLQVENQYLVAGVRLLDTLLLALRLIQVAVHFTSRTQGLRDRLHTG